MPKNDNKRCPQCGGAIDYFGSCRRCGREWTASLEEDELAEGLPEGQQHPAEVKTPAKKRTRTKYTKNSTNNSDSEKADPYALWQITDQDDETEIIKKRSLMRLDSRKTYNQMGLALRAHEATKASLLWLSRLWEFLSDAEQQALTPTLEYLKRGHADLKLVAQSKVNEAAKMELELDKAHKAARRARLRMMDAEAKRRKEAATVQIRPGEDTEGYGVPNLATISPEDLEQLSHEDLLELAKSKLANLDQEKALRKRSHALADDADRDDTGDE
jgi:hypothetical protein